MFIRVNNWKHIKLHDRGNRLVIYGTFSRWNIIINIIVIKDYTQVLFTLHCNGKCSEKKEICT